MRENRTSGTVRIESKDQTPGFGFNGIDDRSLLALLARWPRFSTSSVVKPWAPS
jgi:hypothetical protein